MCRTLCKLSCNQDSKGSRVVPTPEYGQWEVVEAAGKYFIRYVHEYAGKPCWTVGNFKDYEGHKFKWMAVRHARRMARHILRDRKVATSPRTVVASGKVDSP